MQDKKLQEYLGTEYLIREKEPEWELNEQTKKAIYEGMPENLTDEEIAIYIYAKMCKIFKYDEGYLYNDKINRINYSSMFSEGHLRSITPDTKITCADFVRIYEKAVNNLNKGVKAFILTQGTDGHFSLGFSTEKCAVRLDAINLTKNKNNDDKSNDLARAKFGEELEGIYPISDELGLIEKALTKVYPIVQEKEENEEKTTQNLLNKIKKAPREEVIIEPLTYLQKLIDNCKKIGVSGNEFTITLNNILRRNFLGEKFNCSYLGQMKRVKWDMWYKRIIWLREKEMKDGEEPESYLIDTETLEVSSCTDEHMRKILKDGKLIYESEEKTMPEFDKEV